MKGSKRTVKPIQMNTINEFHRSYANIRMEKNDFKILKLKEKLIEISLN